MKHNGTASPRQLSMLAKVLDDYCKRAGIPQDSQERELIAAAIIALYESGIANEEDLAAALSRQLLVSR